MVREGRMVEGRRTAPTGPSTAAATHRPTATRAMKVRPSARATPRSTAAKAQGLYRNTYAESQVQEYWAEVVQNWYNTNLEANPPNGVHNHIDKRDEMLAYDPELYKLVNELLPDKPAYDDWL
jgi:hypothetical protein